MDETIEVVGSNPAGGMGEKVTMIIDKILRVAIVTSINLKSSRDPGEVPNGEVPQPLRLTSHVKAHKNTSIL